ncbi:hypothetical protein CEXT_368911 [Caerostris extrusa]|uniref:Uncharacterized protein n=1 Tax=Caerostris extrusa TaxID=172846 RepID=A0AAV4PCF0_CAEEX|nr:hypothetical protein CEXT_368911 [Caerostris extrusa]
MGMGGRSKGRKTEIKPSTYRFVFLKRSVNIISPLTCLPELKHSYKVGRKCGKICKSGGGILKLLQGQSIKERNEPPACCKEESWLSGADTFEEFSFLERCGTEWFASKMFDGCRMSYLGSGRRPIG